MVKKENKEITAIKKKGISKQWLWLGLGFVLLAAGIGLGFLWMQDKRNPFWAFLTLATVAAGVFIIYRNIKPKEKSIPVLLPGKKITESVVCLNIYAKKNDEGIVYPEQIVFELTTKPEGQPNQCINTGQYYPVNIWDIDKHKLVPFVLPDEKYTDPAFLARYLEQPAQKKYLQHRESLMKYIGPGILAILIIVGFIWMLII